MLLAELNDDELHLLLNHLQLIRVGPNTITDRKVLLREVEKVRKQGYATSHHERLPDAASISVPIKGYPCPVALSVLGPDSRFSQKAMFEVLKEMKRSAAGISLNLLASK